MHKVLVIAEKEAFGACLDEVLREHGCHVSIVESYGADGCQGIEGNEYDLVIATNTSLTPARIQSIIPEIQARHPHARTFVLSGYCPEDFVTDLKQKGIDGFLPLPYEEDALLQELDGLLSMPTP